MHDVRPRLRARRHGQWCRVQCTVCQLALMTWQADLARVGVKAAPRRRLCGRCGAAEIDDALHMALWCTALAQLHVHHTAAGLLHGVQTLKKLYQRSPMQVAAFVLDCHVRSRDLAETGE